MVTEQDCDLAMNDWLVLEQAGNPNAKVAYEYWQSLLCELERCRKHEGELIESKKDSTKNIYVRQIRKRT